MEDIHGVDVSWLHHSSNRDHHHRQHAPSSPGLKRDAPPRTSAHGGLPPDHAHVERDTPELAPATGTPLSPPPTPSSASYTTQKIPIKRPALLNRGSAEKPGNLSPPDKTISRRNSWISSISSKFSSQSSPAQTTHAQAQGSHAAANGSHGPTSSANGALNGIQAAAGGVNGPLEPYVPQPPKGSFISNALRRLSSGSQMPTGKPATHGGVCPRKVMNIDHNRDRCLVPELNQNKLRRVAFCVDVEIAGGPRYKDDVDSEDKKKKRKDRKLKERGEGEALKNPDSVAVEKDNEGVVTVNECDDKEAVGSEEVPNPEGTVIDSDKKEMTKKKEKKKRSEAERKERKEKKRRKAEENGTVPLELTRDDDDVDDATSSPPDRTTSRPQDRPTTDPLRIYRRCCQLRETPILKRISDQLSSPQTCILGSATGVVTRLDLTGSRLQLADMVTLSDWLAVVPVKKVFLEDADLTDEKVRVVLAGLLAAKSPMSSRKRSLKSDDEKSDERSGFIRKLVLKNNPKIGPEGWRHISLFIYMCKSIQALDVSMIPFPKPSPVLSPEPTSTSNSSEVSIPPHHRPTRDVADTFAKAIAERLGGSTLEELVMAECSLAALSVRKIIDGIVVSGVQRLGIAGNDLDSEGLRHVIHYIRSGVCHGIDLGGNDLENSIGLLAECFTRDCPLWLLSLADCDLTPESLRILLPALVALPNFKFLDLSHNRDLLSHQTSLCLLRKYVPQLKELKRLHLMDVSLSPEHAIGLAEIIPESPQLAHLNILENPQITALSTGTDDASQEEAVALYASLTAAARTSQTLICIDVDVPAPDTSELVRALAKQVVAYCLRNMERISEIPEFEPIHRDVEVSDVLMQLVGHMDGVETNHDNDPPPPEEDYIIGGTGVVKALSYCLLQKATDIRRQSFPASGTQTPRSTHPETLEDSAKAKTMSKNLLESARNIRSRLQPALVREARANNDLGYRRLLFLDQTLQGMIQRFEDEYPETRLQPADEISVNSSIPSTSPPASTAPTLSTSMTEHNGPESDDEEHKPRLSRHNSDVSVASRALSLEEGRLHRLGHRVRTELINPSRPGSSSSHQANISGTQDNLNLPDHVLALRDKLFNYSGEELRSMTEQVGWETAFDRLVDNAEQLKLLQTENPEEFKQFRESQIAALKNRNLDIHPDVKYEKDDIAVED